MTNPEYIAGLYMRLSKDDDRAGESVSIENQRFLLTRYADEKGWSVGRSYVDDGYSGTNFERPAFRRMMQDVEDGRINLVLVKDLSRLGRNYIEVGRLTEETLPNLGCRFVAMNDSVDTLLGDNDMMVYRNLFNEFHSKDTSKKVRAVKQACMRQGWFLGAFAPLGYKKDATDKHRLVADERTAHIVRHIFDTRCGGASFRAIASLLDAEGIPPPGTNGGGWNESTVKAILRNEVYIGNMVQGKHGTVSYKNHRLVRKPQHEWIRVLNTHQPLVSKEVWQAVRRLDGRTYKPRQGDGLPNIFAGVLRCGDCGANMRALSRSTARKDGTVSQTLDFICGNYGRCGRRACTAHTISHEVLARFVREDIRSRVIGSTFDPRRVSDTIAQRNRLDTDNYLATYRRELQMCVERIARLDTIVASLYEDRVNGTVGDGTFQSLLHGYETERRQRLSDAERLRGKVDACDDVDAAEQIATTIRAYTEQPQLTRRVVLELVDSIKVYDAGRDGNTRTLDVCIDYRFDASGGECSQSAYLLE